MLFNIVKKKMRGRLAENEHSEKPKKKRLSAAKDLVRLPVWEEAPTPSPQV
jgi:hypothetical protein